MSLPSGYKRLEYIESTGTQYIDTGFKANNNTRVVMDFELTGSNSADVQALYGARGSSTTQCFVFLWTGSRFRTYYNNKYNDIGNADVAGRRIVEQNKETTHFDGEIRTYDNVEFETPRTLMLFASINAATVKWNAYAKLYSCQIYDNDILIRDYVPCEHNRECGLYDKVNGVFYTNAGTGSFIAGPVIDIIPTLIDYRTAEDVDRVNELMQKLIAGTTTEPERNEWLDGLIGAYNAEDLNRVESAVNYIQKYLNGLQYVLDRYRAERKIMSDPFWKVPWDAYDLLTKKDWVLEDIPTDADLARYLSNVDLLTDALAIVKNLPESMVQLDYLGANEIERALIREYEAATAYETGTKQLIDNTKAAIMYSGEIYGGELDA